MKHGRKYGEKESRPLPLWNGILEHRRRMKSALWEFTWCIDKITEEDENGVGWVFGKAPVRAGQIAEDLDEDEKTARENLARLSREKFIIRRRTPYGFVIGVSNSRKFGIWKARETGEKARSDGRKGPFSPEETTGLTGEKARNKEDAAVTQQEDAAAEPPARDAGVWNLLGFQPEEMPSLFRESAEQLYAKKNGQPLAEFVGALMEGWKALGLGKHPPLLAQAAKRIREEARNPVPAPIKSLPDLPFQEKKVGQCQTRN